MNNISTPLMRVTLNAWPEGTPDFVNHRALEKYIQDTSRKTGVDGVTVYGARVTDVRKYGSKWKVTWSTASEDPQSGKVEVKFNTAVRELCFSRLGPVRTRGGC